MYETAADLAALQELIDSSYRRAGRHLLSIHEPARRLASSEMAARLEGMCLLVLATTTADCRPITGPVDGIFYRGAFHFGSAPDSLRIRHIRRRGRVSATHLPGEEMAVTVHGTATEIDVRAPEHSGFRKALLETYVPRYGPGWEASFLDSRSSAPVYARIDAERMFAFAMP